MTDPGLSYKATTLDAALRLLKSGTDSDFPGGGKSESVPDFGVPGFESEDAAEVIEALAVPAGLRSRRVLLDAGWWRRAGGPMIARVAERRRAARGPTPVSSPSLAAGTGWVALAPGIGGYRMRAADDEGRVMEWRVDDSIAARLAPFAFTF
jgi:hypothetical protein